RRTRRSRPRRRSRPSRRPWPSIRRFSIRIDGVWHGTGHALFTSPWGGRSAAEGGRVGVILSEFTPPRRAARADPPPPGEGRGPPLKPRPRHHIVPGHGQSG